MKRSLLLAVAAAFAAVALAHASFAQQYKWVDKNGRIEYGDTPPPGAKATPLRKPSGGPAPAAASKDGKAEPKGPLTPAQQDAEFRKRQETAAKSADKEAKSAEDAKAKRENCSNAQEQLRVLESGQRVARTDEKGERYFIDDEQRSADIARARKAAQQSCS